MMRMRSVVAMVTAYAVSILPAGVYGSSLARSSVKVEAQSSGASLIIEQDSDSRTLSGTLHTHSSTATFTFDGRNLRFGDGYEIRSEIVVNNDEEFVVKLGGFAPGAETTGAEVVIQYDKRSGIGNHPRPENDDGVRPRIDPVTSAGLNQLRLLMSASHDFVVLSWTLPSFASEMPPRNNGRIAANSVLGCIGAAFLYVAAMLDFIGSCGIPEPLEPLACAVAYFAFVGAGVLLADECASAF